MRRSALIAAGIVGYLLAVPLTALAFSPSDVTFTQQSIPGTNGVSYVYFQARDRTSGSATTIPTSRFGGCPTPVYMRWVNIVNHPNSTSFDVQFYDCTTGAVVSDGGNHAGLWFWGPGSQFVPAGMAGQLANAQLIYALNVNLSPPLALPNQDTTLSAAIADDFVAQADRTLNISVDPNGWTVGSWSIDFGDGQTATLPGGDRQIQQAHRYASPAGVKPVVTAHVTGTAQVADFDPATGNLVLLNEPFAVDVTNSTTGQVAGPPIVGYTPPQVRAAALARLAATPPAADSRGSDAVEAPRGTPVYFYVRPIIDAEGQMTLNGKPAGQGHTVIHSWRLKAGSPDGPSGQVTAAGAGGGPDAPIVQQWNSPDRIGSSGGQPYALATDYTVRTTYPDGQTRDYNFTGNISVRVGFAANSG